MEWEPTTEKSTNLSEKSAVTTDDEKSMTLSQKSTTEEDNSMDPSNELAGMKRKIEEDSESDEYEYGDSDESDDDDEEEEGGEDEALNQDIIINGVPYSNEDLLDLVAETIDKADITNRLLNKARRYLKSVEESHGYDITDWPGHIMRLTNIVPRSKMVIGKRHRYPEGYKYMMVLANKAIQEFNKDNNTDFKVESIDQVNSRIGMGFIYYITFTASHLNSDDKVAFQTTMWDNSIDGVIVIYSCNVKQA